MRAAPVARFPGAEGRIPNFTGAEAAALRLRELGRQAARTVKANPDSPQLPVRQRALEDGKTVYMAVPRLAAAEPFFALDPDHLAGRCELRRPSGKVEIGPSGALSPTGASWTWW